MKPMRYQANIITIFISSPIDVPDDRSLIIRTISGWNQRNGQIRRVFFQPLTWEQMVAPDRGGSVQEVIDSQIGANYDIYLGLMWSRFGSSTSKADSGTEDEFDQAIARHDTGEGLTISFLFKNSAIPQDILDGIQYDKVQQFKKKVAAKGCLYREYFDDASLTDAVNLILDRFANESSDFPDAGSRHGSRASPTTPTSGQNDHVPIVQIEGDELGLLDLNEILENESSRFSNIMVVWGSRIEEMGKRTEEAANELNSISRFGQVDPKAAKKIINRVADCTDSLVDWGEENQNLIDDSMEKFAEAFSGLSVISKDFDASNEDIKTGIRAGETLIETVLEANASLEGLARSALSVPRVTKEVIRSNKRLAIFLDRMITKNKTFAANVGIGVDELRRRLTG